MKSFVVICTQDSWPSSALLYIMNLARLGLNDVKIRIIFFSNPMQGDTAQSGIFIDSTSSRERVSELDPIFRAHTQDFFRDNAIEVEYSFAIDGQTGQLESALNTERHNMIIIVPKFRGKQEDRAFAKIISLVSEIFPPLPVLIMPIDINDYTVESIFSTSES